MKIETAIENFSKNKSPGPNGFTGDFLQTFNQDLLHLLLKLFQSTEETEFLPNNFY